MKLIWEDRELYRKGKNLLFHFLAKKFNFTSIEDVEIILSSHMSANKKLEALKKKFIGKAKSLTSPKKSLLPSPWIINIDKEYTGWSLFDANFLPLLTNYGYNIPELKSVYTFKFSTMLDITSSLLFNIKGQFSHDEFLYVNIGDVGGDLFSGVSQLLSLDSNKAINYTSKDIASNVASNAASMVTIFMSACHFVDIDDMFQKIYELCADGAYLIIKEYNLPSSARDKAVFYETAYNLYRILYNEISIEDFAKDIANVAHYKTRYEWVDYISSFGFTPVAINILNENVPYYDGMIMVFIKSLL